MNQGPAGSASLFVSQSLVERRQSFGLAYPTYKIKADTIMKPTFSYQRNFNLNRESICCLFVAMLLQVNNNIPYLHKQNKIWKLIYNIKMPLKKKQYNFIAGTRNVFGEAKYNRIKYLNSGEQYLNVGFCAQGVNSECSTLVCTV